MSQRSPTSTGTGTGRLRAQQIARLLAHRLTADDSDKPAVLLRLRDDGSCSLTTGNNRISLDRAEVDKMVEIIIKTYSTTTPEKATND